MKVQQNTRPHSVRLNWFWGPSLLSLPSAILTSCCLSVGACWVLCGLFSFQRCICALLSSLCSAVLGKHFFHRFFRSLTLSPSLLIFPLAMARPQLPLSAGALVLSSSSFPVLLFMVSFKMYYSSFPTCSSSDFSLPLIVFNIIHVQTFLPCLHLSCYEKTLTKFLKQNPTWSLKIEK